MKLHRILIALLALVVFGAPAAGQGVTPAQWDTLDLTCKAFANNNQNRANRTRCINLVARYRLIPNAVDTVFLPGPTPEPPDTSVVRCEVSPRSGPSVLVGDTLRFRASCYDAQGVERQVAVVWRSGNPPVATVDAGGLARGVAAGFADIYASAGTVEGVSRLEVREPAPEPPDPTEPGVCTTTYANQTINGNLEIPAGQLGCIGPGVQVAGNVIVRGTYRMRPGASLTFLGAVAANYVGGGLQYSTALDGDRGLWVVDDGVLDISCTPKAGWNRTGIDPTWLATDEYWITPTEPRDYRMRRWSPGQPIPRVPGPAQVPAAEVVNVTRDCQLENGHVHIHSTKPQRIEFLRLQNAGQWVKGSEIPVLGRYCLHFHMMGDGSRGSVVRGVASVGCKAFGFVAHASNGVTFVDNVSVNSWEAGFWWDLDARSDDILWDRGFIGGVETPDSIRGAASDADAYNLQAGARNEIRNSVAAAVNGDKLAVCFDWVQPNATDPNAQLGLFKWKFDTGNVSHNCRGPGARFSTNLQEPHLVQNYVSYRNAGSGAENGAYIASTQYRNCVMFEDGYRTHDDNSYEVTGFNAWSSASDSAGIYNCTITSLEGPAIWVTNRQLPAEAYFTVQDVVLIPAPGQPKVFIGPGVQETKPWKACFVRTNVLPEDIVFANSIRNEGSEILIDHADGRKWRVTYTNGQKVVTPR